MTVHDPSSSQTNLWLEDADTTLPAPDAQLLVDVDGFHGPLDLLLALARTHKIDIAQISVLQLVEQYLLFIAETRRLNLEIAADYLVMAAWLAYLKSKLLLPRTDELGEEPTGEQLAAQLAFRLQRLEAMRNAAAALMARSQLGRDVFSRGAPERIKTVRQIEHTAEIYDLLRAYADQRNREARPVHVVKARTVWSIKEARKTLEGILGRLAIDWREFSGYLRQFMVRKEDKATVIASSFGAALEMAREGVVDIRQDRPFGPIYLRRKASGENPIANEV